MLERPSVASPDGRVAILDAGRPTLEIADPPHAASIDAVEVGRRVGGHLRVALRVDGAATTTRALADAGATAVAPPTETAWGSLNARLEGPTGRQLTLFEERPDPG